MLPGVSSTPHTTHDTHRPRDASVSPAEGVSDHVRSSSGGCPAVRRKAAPLPAPPRPLHLPACFHRQRNVQEIIRINPIYPGSSDVNILLHFMFPFLLICILFLNCFSVNCQHDALWSPNTSACIFPKAKTWGPNITFLVEMIIKDLIQILSSVPVASFTAGRTLGHALHCIAIATSLWQPGGCYFEE